MTACAELSLTAIIVLCCILTGSKQLVLSQLASCPKEAYYGNLITRFGKWNVSSDILSIGPKPSDNGLARKVAQVVDG